MSTVLKNLRMRVVPRRPFFAYVFAIFRDRAGVMSADWLHRQERAEHLIEYHGVQIHFPINKRQDEAGWRNRVRYRTKGAA